MSEKNRILVVGAGGNVGRHVVNGLLGHDVEVRGLSRRPPRADLPPEFEAVQGDLGDPDSWAPALEGVDALFLLWPMFSLGPAPAFLEVAARRARHVVFLSSMSVRDDREPAENGFWGEVEQAIEHSGLGWTFLRAGGFATNTLGWADQIRAGSTVRWPYGRAARSLVHERDLADVAVRSLLEKGHLGKKYVLTGPEVLTQTEQVRQIGAGIGRPLTWHEQEPAEAREHLLATWGDPRFVDAALSQWAHLVDEPEPITTTVREVTGTPARTFRQWAADHVADFSSAG